jgi:hypothetical protein
VLLVFGAPCQLRLLAGQEHGRTIPLTDLAHPSRTRGKPRNLPVAELPTVFCEMRVLTFARVLAVPLCD